MWKYAQLLPLSGPKVSLEEGGTPLHSCTRLPGFSGLLVKDESRNPTSSFADRGSTVAISAAIAMGAKSVACATDGDTGASVAAYASKAGLECTIFAPDSAETGKLIQTLVFGARVVRTRGSYQNSVLRCIAACRSPGCHDTTIETNPYAIEGGKTTSFEIADQLGWDSPDFIVVPAGTGTNLCCIWRGYKDLQEAGLVSTLPRMVAAQASACAPIVQAFREGGRVKALAGANSIARSIAVGDPINGEAALTALRESRGIAYSAGDDEIVRAVGLLGSREGIFAEPSSAATVCAAGRLIEDGIASTSDRIVCIITGSGLKVPDSIAKTLRSRLASSWDLMSMDQKSLGSLGSTKLHLLEILEASPSYGYSIWCQLRTRFEEEISLQAIYQHLDEFREMGLTELSEKQTARTRGRRRRYYSLSTRGRRVLASLESVKDSILLTATGPDG